MSHSIATTVATPAQGFQKLSKDEWDAFRQGYVAAAEFTTRDDREGAEMDTHLEDLGLEHSPELVLTIDADIARFLGKRVTGLAGVEDVADLIRFCAERFMSGCPEEDVWRHAGQDFWYTREGHGCGFWDGDWPVEVGEILTQICKLMGPDEWCVGDDHLVYSATSYRFRAANQPAA